MFANQENQLFDAVKKGDIRKVQVILKQSININQQDQNRMTPLMYAAQNNNKDLVRFLITKGADVNKHTGDQYVEGKTALMFAADKGFVDIMKELIAAGADVNAHAGWDQPHAGKPVLRFAIDSKSPQAVCILIKAGAKLNEFTENAIIHASRNQANERNLPLLSSAINSQVPIEIIKELIKAGADVNKKSMIGHWTPLMIAAYRGSSEVIKLLLESGADKTLKNKQDGNRTAFDYAREQGHTKIVQLLQNNK